MINYVIMKFHCNCSSLHPNSSSTMFYKGDNFCDFLFAILYMNLFLKGVYCKKKESASFGSKYYQVSSQLASQFRRSEN